MSSLAAKKSVLIFYVNGRKIREEDVDTEDTLLRYLRKKLQLTGTKEGCSVGACGACTVMVSKYDSTSESIDHFTVNACLTLLVSLHGTAVTTVEGIGSIRTGLHPVQERLAKAHGSQCGFCTPGFVMSMYTLLRNSPQPSMQEIERNLDGNLCRCTGYRPILEGFRTFCSPSNVSDMNGCSKENCCRRKDADKEFVGTEVLFDPGMFKPIDPSQEVIFPPELKVTSFEEELHFKGPKIEFFLPLSFSRLMELKAAYPEGCLVAGNTSVVVQVNTLKKECLVLIEITRLSELHKLEQNEFHVEFGSSLTLTKVESASESIIQEQPAYRTGVLSALVSILKEFGGKQLRNVASIGGSVMIGSPISDLLPLFMASDTKIKLRALEGERSLSISDFYTGYPSNQAKPSEILTSINLPFLNRGEFFKVYKQSRGRVIVNAAFKVKFQDGSNIVSDIRMAFGGIAPTTKMPIETMKSIQGRKWDESLLEVVTTSLLEELQLDPRAPGGMVDYRRTLMISFFFKFYKEVSLEINTEFHSSSSNAVENSLSIEPLERFPIKSMQIFQTVPADQEPIDPIGRPIASVSCLKQATGEAEYIDDIPSFENELHAAYVTSKRPKAKILGIDASPALKIKGVKGFYSAKDLPEDCELEREFFPDEIVECVGQIIGIVVAEDRNSARRGAAVVKVQYEDIADTVITIEDAIRTNSIFDTFNLAKGDVGKGFEETENVIEGEFHVGGQEHFYLEPHAHLVIPREDNELEIHSSTQCLDELQRKISEFLGIPSHKIACKVKRLGGAFGGKEDSIPQVLPLALAAIRTRKPIRIVLDRQDDMLITGGRHPMLSKWKVGFQNNGKIAALKCDNYYNVGWILTLSFYVVTTSTFNSNGPYNIANMDMTGYCCKTNLPSNTAFRGFGTPQVQVLMENIMMRVSDHLSLNHEEVKRINFYTSGDLNLSNLRILRSNLERCWNEVLVKSEYEERKKEIHEFNRMHQYRKRGISVVPLQTSMGYDAPFLNQGAALVHIYRDGTVLISHGGVEFGQGLHTKMIQVASRELQVPVEWIHIAETSTDKVPNAVVTAASVSSDLCGMAVLIACRKILKRLEQIMKEKPDGSWVTWVQDAYFQRVSLSATGFYKTPEISTFDKEARENKHVNYLSFGAAVSEVEVDCLTGHHLVLRTDIVMDVGKSLNPAIDVGQIEGAFVQGMGLYTTEELFYSPSGELLTRSPGVYRLPYVQDIPRKFNVYLLRDSPNPRAIYSSKGIGEPPLLLATSVFSAIREAVKAYRKEGGATEGHSFALDSPATAHKIRMACSDHLTKKVTPTYSQEGSQPRSVRV